nr:basic salivary proline-rich protein 4-like [Bubalus bubalis]
MSPQTVLILVSRSCDDAALRGKGDFGNVIKSLDEMIQVGPSPEGSRCRGGGARDAPSVPHLREGTSWAFIFRDRACGGKALTSPSFLPPPTPSFHAAIAARCRSVGPREPLQLAPALLLLPPHRVGVPSGAPPLGTSPAPHPRPSSGPARRKGGDCWEGGAPPASRGPERAWPRSRQRRAGTHCAARPGSAGSARRAGGAEDAGGLPRPRPALPPPRAPGAPLAALPPPPPRPLRGQREGAGPASRSPRGWRPRIF